MCLWNQYIRTWATQIRNGKLKTKKIFAGGRLIIFFINNNVAAFLFIGLDTYITCRSGDAHPMIILKHVRIL